MTDNTLIRRFSRWTQESLNTQHTEYCVTCRHLRFSASSSRLWLDDAIRPEVVHQKHVSSSVSGSIEVTSQCSDQLCFPEESQGNKDQ